MYWESDLFSHKSVRLIYHSFHKVCDVKKIKKKQQQDNQTAFAGSEKKKFIQDGAQRHVAYCPITLRPDKQT